MYVVNSECCCYAFCCVKCFCCSWCGMLLVWLMMLLGDINILWCGYDGCWWWNLDTTGVNDVPAVRNAAVLLMPVMRSIVSVVLLHWILCVKVLLDWLRWLSVMLRWVLLMRVLLRWVPCLWVLLLWLVSALAVRAVAASVSVAANAVTVV